MIRKLGRLEGMVDGPYCSCFTTYTRSVVVARDHSTGTEMEMEAAATRKVICYRCIIATRLIDRISGGCPSTTLLREVRLRGRFWVTTKETRTATGEMVDDLGTLLEAWSSYAWQAYTSSWVTLPVASALEMIYQGGCFSSHFTTNRPPGSITQYSSCAS